MESTNVNPVVAGSIGFLILIGSLVAMTLLILIHIQHPVSPRKLTERIQNRAWSTRQVVGVGACFVGLILIIPFIGLLMPNPSSPAVQLITILLFAIAQVLMLIAIGYRRRTSWKEDFAMGWRELRTLRPVPLFYMAIILPIGLTSFIVQLILKLVWGIEPDLQEAAWLIATSKSWTRFGYIALAVLVAPLYEELIFRGVIFPYLVRRIGLVLGIATVSVLFAIIHLNLASIVPIILLSVALCLAYWRTGSLWTSIGLHAVFNGVSVAILCYMM